MKKFSATDHFMLLSFSLVLLEHSERHALRQKIRGFRQTIDGEGFVFFSFAPRSWHLMLSHTCLQNFLYVETLKQPDASAKLPNLYKEENKLSAKGS